MKKANLTIIATIIATFVISMFAIQPMTTEASNNATPNATPSPRTKRPKTIQSPKTSNRQSKVIRDGKLTAEEIRKERNFKESAAQYNPKEISIDNVVPVRKSKVETGITTSSSRTAKTKRKAATSTGDQPEMQITDSQTPAETQGVKKMKGDVTGTSPTQKIRKTPRQTIEVENDETHLKTKVKTKKPAYIEGGVNDTTNRKSRRKRN